MTKINIITRTANRPNYFSDCYRSVSQQFEQENLVHWITSDDDETFAYLENYENVHVVQIIRPKRKNKQHFPYNKYFHEVLTLITEDGWVMVLDDDDMLVDVDSISKLRQKMAEHQYNDSCVFIWRIKLPNGNIIPSSCFNTNKLNPDEITNNCFCFHTKHKDLVNFESCLKAEFNVLTTLINNLKPVWIDDVLVAVNNSDQENISGSRIDRQVNKTKIALKNKNGATKTNSEQVNLSSNTVKLASNAVEIVQLDYQLVDDQESQETSSIVDFDERISEAVLGSHLGNESTPSQISENAYDLSVELTVNPTVEIIPVMEVESSSAKMDNQNLPDQSDENKSSQFEIPLTSSDHESIIIQHISKESTNLAKSGLELVNLVEKLVEINRKMRECLERNCNLVEQLNVAPTLLQVNNQPDKIQKSVRINLDSLTVDTNSNNSDHKIKREDNSTRLHNKLDIKKYQVIDDQIDESKTIISNVYIFQQNKGDKNINQLVELFKNHSISVDLIDINPKNKFNQLLKTIIADSVKKNYQRIAIISGYEIIIHNKFFDLFERHLNEVTDDFHLLFMCHKLTQVQIKELSRNNPDISDYKFLYDDMKSANEKTVQTHWKTYGFKEFRVPRIVVESAKNIIDNRWGVVINQSAIVNLQQMLGSMNANGLQGDSILIEYQKKYNHNFHCLPNLIIPRQPNQAKLKKICTSNGWFHHFFDA